MLGVAKAVCTDELTAAAHGHGLCVVTADVGTLIVGEIPRNVFEAFEVSAQVVDLTRYLSGGGGR